ncbi:MAG: AI-2E family transporter [Clostridia bacterium]|nr:AI-2E family transporter [Clostridia bacterium]
MNKVETKFLLKLAGLVFALYLCIHYWPSVAIIFKTAFAAVFPLLIGTAVAYPLDILTSFFERHLLSKSSNKIIVRTRRGLSVALALLSLVSIVTVIIALVVPQLTKCVKMLIDEIPDALTLVVAQLDKFEFVPDDIIGFLSNIDWQSKISSIISTITSGVGSVMSVVISTVSSVISGVTTTVLAVIFAIYVLLSKNKLLSQLKTLIKHYVPEKIAEKAYYVSSVANDSFHKFIVAQCTEAVILGALCTLGMFILRLPYAAMIGAVTVVTAFIPVVGALLGGAIGAFLILMESPVKALVFIIFIVLLQQIEGDLIYPKVVGNSMGLPSIWVLAAVTVGAGMFGVIGMLLSVPAASTVYRLIKNDVARKDALLTQVNSSSDDQTE